MMSARAFVEHQLPKSVSIWKRLGYAVVLPAVMGAAVFLMAGIVTFSDQTDGYFGQLGVLMVSPFFLLIGAVLNLWVLVIPAKSGARDFALGALVPGALLAVGVWLMHS